ncbi:MAG: ATPase [Epsilonproteobacteria bacterium]|jgi:F-type H+-transporting ATPase subunit b|nr:ATPase [Campylobacterota bacterium]
MVKFWQKGVPMLDINVGLMLFEAGIFLITLVLLNKWLFQPLVKFMEERDAKLKQSLNQIEGNSEEVEKLQKEIEEILHRARVDANRIREEARLEAVKQAEVMKMEKMEELEKAKAQLQREIEQEKRELMEALQKEEPQLKALLETKFKGVA